MYYPKYVYHKNENITRENMRKYNEMQDKIYKARKEIESKTGHKMNAKERYQFEKEWRNNNA